MMKTKCGLTVVVAVMASIVLSATSANAGVIMPTSYTYGSNAESQPQPPSFQLGLLSDVGNTKLTDDILSSGSWNDGTNVGFRNDTDNGNPQPRVTFDLNGLYNVLTVDVYSVVDFLSTDESVSIASSVDGINFSTVVVQNPMVWTGTSLKKASIDVSSLPDGQFIRVDFFDDQQWMMLNEVDFDGELVPEPSSIMLIGVAGGFGLFIRRRFRR